MYRGTAYTIRDRDIKPSSALPPGTTIVRSNQRRGNWLRTLNMRARRGARLGVQQMLREPLVAARGVVQIISANSVVT
jgi:hypothetical protein